MWHDGLFILPDANARGQEPGTWTAMIQKRVDAVIQWQSGILGNIARTDGDYGLEKDVMKAKAIEMKLTTALDIYMVLVPGGAATASGQTRAAQPRREKAEKAWAHRRAMAQVRLVHFSRNLQVAG